MDRFNNLTGSQAQVGLELRLWLESVIRSREKSLSRTVVSYRIQKAVEDFCCGIGTPYRLSGA